MKNLAPEQLLTVADTALFEFSRRIHEVPAKDLPACAAVLLQLAERGKAKPTKSKNPAPDTP